MLEAGDILSRLLLDTKQFRAQLAKTQKEMQAALGQMGKTTQTRARGMTRDMESFGKKSQQTARLFGSEWWASFGRVAIGFTIAYRAMNVFEAGLRKLADVVRDSIRESGELASIQAKLAFWYKMHSDEMIDYNEAFERAAVNTQALMRANVTALSSLEELSTGMDEVAQSVGAIPAELTGALADVVDFTVMVAQTTGSTTRQVRQELQALMQGQMRTTNILIRSLKNLGAISDEEIANLKAMTNRAEIFEKILRVISENWADLRDRILETDVTLAMKFWEKQIRATLTTSVQLASKLEEVGNIFAVEFARRGYEARDALEEGLNDAMKRNIVLMQRLRDALALGLDMFEKVVDAVGQLAVVATNLSGPLETVAKILAGYLAFGAIEKVITKLGAAFLWLAQTPMRLLLKVTNSLYVRFLAIPAAIVAAAIAVEVSAEMMSDKIDGLKEKMDSIVPSAKSMADRVKNATRGLIDVEGTIKILGDAYEYWREKITGAEVPDALKDAGEAAGNALKSAGETIVDIATEFLDRFKDKAVSHFEVISNYLAPLINKIGEQFKSIFKLPEMDIDLKELGEGLGWAFKEGAEEASKAIQKLKDQIRDLEITYEVNQKIMEGLRERKIEPEDVDLFREILTNQAKYNDLVKEVGPELAHQLVTLQNGIALQKEREALLERARELEQDVLTPLEIYEKKFKELVKLGPLMDPELYRRNMNKIKEEYLEALDDMKEAANEFAEITREALSDIFVDAMKGELKDFEDYWNAFCEGLYRIFADSLVKMVEQWVTSQATMQAAGSAAGAGGAALGGLGGAAIPLAGAAMAYGMIQSYERKKEAERAAEMRRIAMLGDTWSKFIDEAIDLIHPLDKITEALNDINKRFNEWRSSLVSLGATSSELAHLEELRAEALAKTRQRLKEEFEAPLEDIIAKIELAPTDYERRELRNWYDEQIDAARALGSATVELLREAYELSKQQLILEQQAALMGVQEEATGIIETMGMSPMMMQLYNLEKWQESMSDQTNAIREEMDKIPGIIQDYVEEIAGLEDQYNQAFTDIEAAGADFDSMVALTADRFSFLQDTYGPEWWANFVSALEEGILDISPSKIVGDPAASWQRAFETAWAEYQRIITEAQQDIETIPGEIEDINEAIREQERLLEQLEEDFEEAGGAVAEAYRMQFEALKETFIEGLEEIIRSHTWSEYEQGLWDLNQWYLEQLEVMEALGIQTDLLTQAYDLQRQALLETALESSDLTDALDDWRNVLFNLQDQILEMQTSLMNPQDILNRMRIMEDELTRILGESWKQGVISTEGMAAETVERASDLLGEYLGMAADAFQRPSIEYQQIYGTVLAALMDLEEYAQETVTDLEIQMEQLEAQLEMVRLLQDIATGSPTSPEISEGMIGGIPLTENELYIPEINMPSLQTGIDYVPRTGPYLLHEGEKVMRAGTEEGMLFNITVNESATPRDTAMAVKDELFRLLRTGAGRKEIQLASRGR